MQDDIDMEPLHKLFIYRKKLVKTVHRAIAEMDGRDNLYDVGLVHPYIGL